MSLNESVRQWVIRTLPYDRSDTEVFQALQDKDAHGLLVAFHNWNSRLVRPVPRQIRKSRTYQRHPYGEPYSNALSAIEQDVRSGNDITKYLSRGVRVALGLPGRRGNASDLDMLLNDWGVHHLHLSSEIQADGFVRRTGPLLLVRFTEHAAYFLDVAGHGEWAKETVLDSLVNEFPEAGGAHVLRGVVGLTRDTTDEEHHRFRAAGVNVARMIGDKAVIGGGYNLQGRTITAIRDADRLLLEIQNFEDEWNENEAGLREQLERQGVVLPAAPCFEFAIDEEGPLIVETVSGTGLRIFH